MNFYFASMHTLESFLEDAQYYLEILPILLHVQVLFLPKNTTIRLQPLDAGVIAVSKRGCRKMQVHRAVDLIESGKYDSIHDLNIREAIENINNVWAKLNVSTIQNCWLKTGVIDCESE